MVAELSSSVSAEVAGYSARTAPRPADNGGDRNH